MEFIYRCKSEHISLIDVICFQFHQEETTLNFNWLLSALLGGLIGYITNDIAIRMLFHPRKPVYIRKFRLPFTPGLIPKQKRRIAKSVGDMISSHLLDSKTLKENLLSEEALESLKRNVTDWLEACEKDERTLEQVLLSLGVPKEKMDYYQEKLLKEGSAFILQKIADAKIGASISENILKDAEQYIGRTTVEILMATGLGNMLSEIIDNQIRKNAPETVENSVRQIRRDVLSMRLCDVYAKYRNRIPSIAESATQLYRRILENGIDKILTTVDIAGIVTNKVSGFSAEQLETVVFGVMKRELRAIVYLGAMLGFLLGCLNILL